MSRVIAWFQAFALGIGAPGLFLVAILDSSFLSLPEVSDLLIVSLTIQHPHRMLYYASMASIGSIVGCFLLYGVGRTGGHAFLQKRFHERHIDRAMDWFRRYGLLAVAVPAILPPPMPFKIFVLLAGVSRVHPVTFGLATMIGRGVRYFGVGLLALWYGEAASEYLRRNGPMISLVLGVAVLLGGVLYTVIRARRRRGSAGGAPSPDATTHEPGAQGLI